MRLKEYVRHHFFRKEFILFLLVGTFNTFFCSMMAKLLEPLLGNANIAFNIGYIIANIVAYGLNGRLIFPSPLTVVGYGKFFLSYVPNYVIQNIIVFIVYNMLDFPSLAAYIIAAILGVPITYLFVKIFAFGRA